MDTDQQFEAIQSLTGISRGHWSFTEHITPAGNAVGGFVSRSENRMLGAFANTAVNGTPCLRIYRAMPAIHYPLNRTTGAFVYPGQKDVVHAAFVEKLDGTCIIFYPLRDAAGTMLEVVARTRLVPVLLNDSIWGDWPSLLRRVATDAIDACVRETGLTLCFELWGADNAHMVEYRDALRLTLHTVVAEDGALLPLSNMHELASRYGFDTPRVLWQSDAVRPSDIRATYARLQGELEDQNRAATIKPSRPQFVVEGSILVLSTAVEAFYWKLKPPTMMDVCIQAAGESRFISRHHVLAAIYKLLENGTALHEDGVALVRQALLADWGEPAVALADQQGLVERVLVPVVAEIQLRQQVLQAVAQYHLDVHQPAAALRQLSQHFPRALMGRVGAIIVRLGQAS